MIFSKKTTGGETYIFEIIQEYDPLSEAIPREPIVINGKLTYLPSTMFDIPVVIALHQYGSFKDILLKTTGKYSKEREQKLYKGFIKDRFKHDFEYWALTCIKNTR